MAIESVKRRELPIPEKYKRILLFKKQPIFNQPLEKPRSGEKVYVLTEEQINEIIRIRSERVELDPGMGGVLPTKIREWIKQGIKITSLDFMLTKRCNFNCTWCFAASSPWASEYLSFDCLETTIHQAAKIGTKLFILTGGEPLMYRDPNRNKNFFDVVDCILSTYKEEGQQVKVLTFDDVALITPDIAEKLAARKIGLCTKGDTLDGELQDYKLQTRGAFNFSLFRYGKRLHLASRRSWREEA